MQEPGQRTRAEAHPLARQEMAACGLGSVKGHGSHRDLSPVPVSIDGRSSRRIAVDVKERIGQRPGRARRRRCSGRTRLGPGREVGAAGPGRPGPRPTCWASASGRAPAARPAGPAPPSGRAGLRPTRAANVSDLRPRTRCSSAAATAAPRSSDARARSWVTIAARRTFPACRAGGCGEPARRGSAGTPRPPRRLTSRLAGRPSRGCRAQRSLGRRVEGNRNRRTKHGRVQPATGKQAASRTASASSRRTGARPSRRLSASTASSAGVRRDDWR